MPIKAYKYDIFKIIIPKNHQKYQSSKRISDGFWCWKWYILVITQALMHCLIYRIYILGNFRGKILSLFLRIYLQPQNFNYTKNACSININDKYMAILENLFTKGMNPRKFCSSKISQYTVAICTRPRTLRALGHRAYI